MDVKRSYYKQVTRTTDTRIDRSLESNARLNCLLFWRVDYRNRVTLFRKEFCEFRNRRLECLLMFSY